MRICPTALLPLALVAVIGLTSCGDDSSSSSMTPTTPTTPGTPTTPTTPSTGTLTGTVTDASSSAPISGATVVATGPTGVIALADGNTTTGADGSYSLAELTPGTYMLVVQHQGHRNYSDTVTVASGDNSRNVAIIPALVTAGAGDWTGSWTNTTFGTSGSVTMTVAADTIAQTFTITFDMNGGVFGVGDPPAETQTVSYTISMGGTLMYTSAFYGDVSITVDPMGNITGSCTKVPASSIDRVDFTGTATATTVTGSAVISFTGGGTANATLSMNKVGGGPSTLSLALTQLWATVHSFYVR